MVSKVVYLQNSVRRTKTRPNMMIYASRQVGNQKETLLSQNSSSMEIDISNEEVIPAAKLNHQSQHMILENKACN
jgi:hypothetical protein